MMLGLQCCQIAVLLIYDEAEKSVTPPLVMSIHSEQEDVTNICTKENEVDSTRSDDGTDDRGTSESDASQVSSTTHEE